MIKIEKNTSMSATPLSLRPPKEEFFEKKKIHRTASTTANKRKELIAKSAYTDTEKYNSRYKSKDIKKSLIKIYKYKCAFCEQIVESFHVEHYRPKQTYYWLAFSWDNLLCACHYCNVNKGVQFKINGTRASYKTEHDDYINTLSGIYDEEEKPDLINPEITDPSGLLIFNQDGNLSSNDTRMKYTITTCKIFRTYLRDKRKKILDDLRRDLRSAFVENATIHEQGVAIQTIIRRFIADSKDPDKEFLAFRRYILENWIRDEIHNAKHA